MILEEREHALRRGAAIHGELLGGGSGCDAMPGGGLDPDGAAPRSRSPRPCARPGSTLCDRSRECSRIRVLSRRPGRGPRFSTGFHGTVPPVTALKGYMGTLVSGCGAVELIASLIGVNRGVIPPALNCDEPDPACALDVVRGSPRPTRNPIFVNTNLTRNGQAAALVVRGFPAEGSVD